MSLFRNCTMTHEAFMQRALFDPVEGYYAQKALLGTSGDFSTSATLSPAFAEAIAHWIDITATHLGLERAWPVIELGPGDGTLAQGIQTQLEDAIELHLVESSQPLKLLQLQKVPQCTHHATLKDALTATGGTALIVANEFVDAFPAMQLCWNGTTWTEVCVRYDEYGIPEEGQIPFEHGVDAEAPLRPQLGQRLYIHPSYYHWMQENLPGLKKGVMLTIDYGQPYPARECRAYAKHERYEGIDVYKAPGTRDITCDVNFADLQRWGEQIGLETSSLKSQRDFLLENLSDADVSAKSDPALEFLMNSMGAGGAFLCLEQVR